MSVKEIEAAIVQLPVQDVAELMAWLAEYHHAEWDKQIEYDLDSGRLDTLLAEVDQEYEAGLARPLWRTEETEQAVTYGGNRLELLRTLSS